MPPDTVCRPRTNAGFFRVTTASAKTVVVALRIGRPDGAAHAGTAHNQKERPPEDGLPNSMLLREVTRSRRTSCGPDGIRRNRASRSRAPSSPIEGSGTAEKETLVISLPHERQAVPAPSPSNIRVAVVPAAVMTVL